MPVDTAARPAPPAPRTGKTASRTAAPARPSRTQARAEGLNSWFQMASLLSVARGNLADAGAFAEHGPPIAAETASFAEGNETAARIVDYIVEAGPYAALLTVIMPLVLQLTANHGRIDAGKLGAASGIVPPDVLEAKVKAQMEREKARYLKEAEAARAEVARLTEMNGGA